MPNLLKKLVRGTVRAAENGLGAVAGVAGAAASVPVKVAREAARPVQRIVRTGHKEAVHVATPADVPLALSPDKVVVAPNAPVSFTAPAANVVTELTQRGVQLQPDDLAKIQGFLEDGTRSLLSQTFRFYVSNGAASLQMFEFTLLSSPEAGAADISVNLRCVQASVQVHAKVAANGQTVDRGLTVQEIEQVQQLLMEAVDKA